MKPYAERGSDEHLHYVLPDRIGEASHGKRPRRTRLSLARHRSALAAGATDRNRRARSLRIKPDGSRWPWDRPPADLSWHDATDADQDIGQERVFANT